MSVKLLVDMNLSGQEKELGTLNAARSGLPMGRNISRPAYSSIGS
jgi:hypothetical protein